ncbi:MAG TPA: DUF2232 domain-containing protein [Spirochaetota bacterium]
MSIFALMIPGGLALLFAGAFACRRWGYYALAGALPLLGAIIAASLAYHDLLTFLAAALIIGCVSGCTFKYGRSMQYLIIASSCAIALVGAGHYYYLLFAKKIDIVVEARQQARTMIANASLSSPDQELKEGLVDDFFGMVKKAFPFYYVCVGAVWTFFGFIIVRFPFRKGMMLLRGIDQFRLNDYCIIPLIASIGVYAVTMTKHSAAHIVALNLLLILSFFYLIQGLGIVKYFLLRKGIPTMLLPATALLVLIVGWEATVVSSICFAGFGALDLWADFRGFTKKKSGTDGDNSI